MLFRWESAIQILMTLPISKCLPPSFKAVRIRYGCFLFFFFFGLFYCSLDVSKYANEKSDSKSSWPLLDHEAMGNIRHRAVGCHPRVIDDSVQAPVQSLTVRHYLKK